MQVDVRLEYILLPCAQDQHKGNPLEMVTDHATSTRHQSVTTVPQRKTASGLQKQQTKEML